MFPLKYKAIASLKDKDKKTEFSLRIDDIKEMKAITQRKTKKLPHPDYSRFKKINGTHSFKESVPKAFVDYEVRKRHGGKVAFFNFDLAKEIGLIPEHHAHKINKKLEQSILDTFSLMIINEYDKIHQVKILKKDIKPHKYMATRYLQLQHPDKRGLTSGDGRSIWNGEITHKGRKWDVSSCGTGATCLSPATSKYKKFFKTGDPSISYGCGYSEIDEGFSTLFFSEILFRNELPTERVLALIEFDKGISISVRAHENLLRPSHFFNHLRQGNLESLKQITDYYMKRVHGTGIEKLSVLNDVFLEKIVDDFAKITAKFEDDYIFCWLDWDGDNILMNGGIIDYGSIRQFGLFHHEYRYDDVDRFSTNIKEQKQKSRYIVQKFIQMVDFIKSGHKKHIEVFAQHRFLKKFDQLFEEYKDKNFVHKLGFSGKNAQFLLDQHRDTIKSFRKVFSHFERAKAKKGLHKVTDGVTWDAIFCMRDLLRELPQLFLLNFKPISCEEFIEIVKSSYAKKSDLKLNPYRERKIKTFQAYYLKLIELVAQSRNWNKNRVLLELTTRSSIINKYDRVTGDSITRIIDKLLKKKPRLSPDEVFEVLTDFVDYQDLNPDKKNHHAVLTQKEKSCIKNFLEILRDDREGI